MRLAPPFTFGGIRRGFLMALSLGPGIVIYALVFGVLAAEAKLSTLEAVAMSAGIYSGSAQIAALQSWSGAAHIAPVVAAIIMMNARYLLYGAALRPWMGSLHPAQTYASLFFLGDANWAMSLKEEAAGNDDAGFVLGSGLAMFIPWCLGTLAGHLGGRLISEPGVLGLDFMLAAFSAAMAVAMWKGRDDLMPAIVAAGVGIGLSFVLSGGWVIVAAGLASATVGYLTYVDRA